jgi:preprotein translocase subunit Sss1
MLTIKSLVSRVDKKFGKPSWKEFSRIIVRLSGCVNFIGGIPNVMSVVERQAVEHFTPENQNRFRQSCKSSINVQVASIQAGTSLMSGVPTYV